MNDLNLSDLSAAQRQRLAFIEFRLWFYGAVARKEVLERFEVATAAGTRDMALFKELAPGNVRYERKQYAYQAGFRPLFHHAVDQVLAALTTGWGAGGAVAGGDPISHAVPARLNQPSLDILATVTRAIAGGDALQLVYHSMKTGPGLREIVPHSLVDSGLRWHVRAFDRTKGHFRDLVLTRMEQVQPVASAVPIVAQELVAADVQWQQPVALQLVPTPATRSRKRLSATLACSTGTWQSRCVLPWPAMCCASGRWIAVPTPTCAAPSTGYGWRTGRCWRA